MTKEDFSVLSPEVRKIWSKITNNMKAFMLLSRTADSNDGVNNHNIFFYQTLKPPSYPPMKFTKALMHEILTELISESSLSEKNEVDTPKYE